MQPGFVPVPTLLERKISSSFPFPDLLSILFFASKANAKREASEASPAWTSPVGTVEASVTAAADSVKAGSDEARTLKEAEGLKKTPLRRLGAPQGSKGGRVLREASGAAGAPVRTLFVFTDVPWHSELRAGDLPLMEVGTVMDFDVKVSDPGDPGRARSVSGPYSLVRRSLKYSGSRPGLQGITQYLEWEPSQARR